MLNRRLLRVKVMQALYGLKQAERSDYFLSLDHIADIFAPDLNSMEPQNHEELKKNKEQASELFSEYFTDSKPELHSQPEKIRLAVEDAYDLFLKRLKKDQKHYKVQMLSEADKVFESYVLALKFIIDLVEYSTDDEEEETTRFIKQKNAFPVAKNLRENHIYKLLKEDNELEMARIKNDLSWEREIVRRTYKDILKQSEEVATYLGQEETTFEEDAKILLYIAKNCIFKNESVLAFFEERDFNWVENKTIVKGLVTKTIKTAEPKMQKMLLDISGNWEDDKGFFEELFLETIKKEGELEKYIEGKAQNWDKERLAMTDRIILKMALTEMIIFPSIPVKVSINEYIELSKVYSTPKSKQFINGMLDSLSLELINKGIIRKSGRGLIDNK